MTAEPSMSLPEWLVLAILSQQPMHGFAVAQLTAADGELGRVWQIPKAVIYRAIGRLLDAGLVVPQSTEQGLGPQRTIYAATPEGSEAAQRWLHTPVAARAGHPLSPAAQARPAGPGRRRPGGPAARASARSSSPIAEAIEDQRAQSGGFEATLLAWRRATAVAALDFLDTITEPAPSRT